jgi:hypothetical protein
LVRRVEFVGPRLEKPDADGIEKDEDELVDVFADGGKFLLLRNDESLGGKPNEIRRAEKEKSKVHKNGQPGGAPGSRQEVECQQANARKNPVELTRQRAGEMELKKEPVK